MTSWYENFDVVDVKAWMSTLEWTVAVTVIGCMFVGYGIARIIERFSTQKEKTDSKTHQPKTRSSGQKLLDADTRREVGLADAPEEEENEDDDEDRGAFRDEEDLQHLPFSHQRYSDEEMVGRAAEFYSSMNKRRSVRFISSDPVPSQVIEHIIHTAGTSPSGGHTEPWTYVVVHSPETKAKVREIIEAEEYVNYTRRMGDQWVQDLTPLKTTWQKPYLTEAPYIILLFRQLYSTRPDGRKQTHYYNELSTAISAGFLLLAIQTAGLVTVTTTPMNCGPRLRELLGRPSNEKLMLLFPVGFPKDDATVPDLHRKPLSKYMVMV